MRTCVFTKSFILLTEGWNWQRNGVTGGKARLIGSGRNEYSEKTFPQLLRKWWTNMIRRNERLRLYLDFYGLTAEEIKILEASHPSCPGPGACYNVL